MKRCGWILVALLSLWSASAWAQATATTGQIEGTITDESKGALPGVTVTVHNVQTGFMREGVTDEAGRYRLSLLPLGTHELTANLQGFSPVKQAGLLVNLLDQAESSARGMYSGVTVAAQTLEPWDAVVQPGTAVPGVLHVRP